MQMKHLETSLPQKLTLLPNFIQLAHKRSIMYLIVSWVYLPRNCRRDFIIIGLLQKSKAPALCSGELLKKEIFPLENTQSSYGNITDMSFQPEDTNLKQTNFTAANLY